MAWVWWQGRRRSRLHRARQSARRRGNFAGVTGRREGARESTAWRVGEGLCCLGSLARLRMADLDGTVRQAVVTVFARVGLFSGTMSLTTMLTSVHVCVVMCGQV